MGKDLKNLHYLPIVVFIWFPATFVITYITAVELKDVPALYPYISDTGTFSPESCIFGQLLNMGSILMGLAAYLRYRQVRYICENHSIDKDVRKYNRISLWTGLIGAFGISIVANFQETNILSIHLLGAFLAFGVGSIYMTASTIASFKIFPIMGTKFSVNARIVLTLLCGLNNTVCFVTATMSFLQFDGTDMTKWNKDNGGYTNHVISALTEWITGFSMMGFILSFTNDFKLLSMKEPPIFVDDNNVIAHSVSSQPEQRQNLGDVIMSQ